MSGIFLFLIVFVLSILEQKNVPNDFYYIDLESVEKGMICDVSIINKSNAPSRAQRVLSVGDILFQTVRPYQQNNYFFKEENKIPTVASTGYAQIRAHQNNKFLYYLLHTSNFNKNVLIRCTGSNYPAINSTDLSEIDICLPSIEEQEKIASFFSLIDKKIELQTEKVEELKNYKKGIMQKIFSQELRFKDENGNEYPEWLQARLDDAIFSCIHEVKKPSNPYWRLGIRSHGKGTFHEYVEDPNKVAMDKLYEVKNDMLIVNITFAWEHAIAVTTEEDEGKLVSHRFPTYMFKENALKNFYKYYILLPRFKKFLLDCSPGGAGRNRVLNKRAFLEIPIMIPSLEEQKIISELLTSMDKKIEKEQETLELLNQYKKGLLQQMFI